jgi:hypothetical protein
MSVSMTTEVFINIEKAKDEALDFTTSVRHWRLEAIACLSVFDCYITFVSIIPWSSIIFGYHLRPLMHIVWSPFSLQSFLFNLIKSYLLSLNSSSLASLNLGARFFLKGVVCHIPKFPFHKVNRFPKGNSKFSKGFQLFSFKMILNLNLSLV